MILIILLTVICNHSVMEKHELKLTVDGGIHRVIENCFDILFLFGGFRYGTQQFSDRIVKFCCLLFYGIGQLIFDYFSSTFLVFSL